MKKTPMRKNGMTMAMTIPAIAPDERLLWVTTSAPCVVLVALGKTGRVDVVTGRTGEVDMIGVTDGSRGVGSVE
jgi:hypothetical protein